MRRAIAGVVLGALLLAGCSGGSDDGGASGDDTGTVSSTTLADGTTTTGGAGGELTNEEWVEAADEICAAADDAFANNKPAYNDDPMEWVETQHEIVVRQRDELQALGLPTDEGHDEVEQVFGLLDDRITFFEDAVAESDGDDAALRRFMNSDGYNEVMDAIRADISDLNGQLGLKVCR